jgi:hypothetical protein
LDLHCARKCKGVAYLKCCCSHQRGDENFTLAYDFCLHHINDRNHQVHYLPFEPATNTDEFPSPFLSSPQFQAAGKSDVVRAILALSEKLQLRNELENAKVATNVRPLSLSLRITQM